MCALFVPPWDYGYSFTLSEHSRWKWLVHMLSVSTNPVGVLFTIYYVHIFVLYYTIYYVYIAVSWLYKRLIHRGSRISQQGYQTLAPPVCKRSGNWRVWLGNPEDTAGDRITKKRWSGELHRYNSRASRPNVQDIRRNTAGTRMKFSGRYLIIWELNDAGQFNLPSTCDDVNLLCLLLCSAVWNRIFEEVKRKVSGNLQDFSRCFDSFEINNTAYGKHISSSLFVGE